MGLDKGKIIRTWRLALTCIFLFLISWYYQIPESSWSLVTIWFVMYEYSTVGGVLNKSLLRFLGTLISAVYGIVIIYSCGNDPIINILALIAGLFFYTYWFMGNDKTYTGTIGAVTLTIVLLNYNNIEVAVLRTVNVLLGIITSVFMIRFFYPQYARNLIIETQVLWLNQLEQMIKDYLNINKQFTSLKSQIEHNELAFLANVAAYNRLIGEAKMETKTVPSFCFNSTVIKEYIQRLFRLINVFIILLPTEEARTNPWVIKQLLILLEKLCTIKFLLFNEQEALICDQPFAALKEDEFFIPNEDSLASLFQEINTNLLLLEKVIRHNILIYDYYDDAIPHRLRAST